ncbi:oligosaccharide flippase family protein [Flavobacterium sp. ZT3R18]|uniref:oligosaccharide flippase family protein n=1 Tax=Flavobacterium sp. ZT3R18 TaxID=2594429 RepID=UPI00117A1A79|nr:oligosaccharide flippase family protein [Flavobacterium sp. ZT3R18]TRX37852.1 oligosaccharide flippase family protein [Flavobacterium sp. ZT3R18]
MKIEKKIKAVKDYLIYGSGQLINLIAPLLVAPKVISVCGIENWGKVGVALSIFTLLGLFVDFGSNLLGVKEISANKNDFSKIRSYLNLSFSFKLIILFVLLVPVSLTILVFDIKESNLYFLGLFMLSAQFFNITWIYQGLEKFSSVNRLIFFSKSIYILLVFILVKKSDDYIYVLFLLGVSNTLVYSFFYFKMYSFYNLSLFKVDLYLLKEYVKNEYSILISNISISIYTQCPILIIRYLLGDYYAGIYKIGDMILSVFRSYLSVFFNVSFPKFCSTYTENKSNGILFLKKVNSINILLLLIGIFSILVFGITILNTVVMNSKTYDLIVFYSGFIIVPIVIAINIPFYQFLIYKNQQKILSIILSLSSILMLFGCYFFTKMFHLKGSLIAVFLIETIISSLIIGYCCVKYGINLKAISLKIK